MKWTLLLHEVKLSRSILTPDTAPRHPVFVVVPL